MKLIILAFILSLIIHFLPIGKELFGNRPINNLPHGSKDVNKTSKATVKYVKILPKIEQIQNIQTEDKEKSKNLVKKKNIPTTKIYKKVEKKNILPQKRDKKNKKIKKILAKPIKKIEVKPSYTKPLPKKKIVKPQEKRKTIPKKSLENFLLADPVPLDRNMLDDITKSYINLYGEEFNSFTKVQKVFLQKNLVDIGKITERYLRYPSIAVRTGQQGMNIVQFYLHPNGDISDLKLTDSSGFTSLDKNTVETIEIAYKDYPRPKTKTKIKIYVFYKLY